MHACASKRFLSWKEMNLRMQSTVTRRRRCKVTQCEQGYSQLLAVTRRRRHKVTCSMWTELLADADTKLLAQCEQSYSQLLIDADTKLLAQCERTLMISVICISHDHLHVVPVWYCDIQAHFLKNVAKKLKVVLSQPSVRSCHVLIAFS